MDLFLLQNIKHHKEHIWGSYIVISMSGSSEMDSAESRAFSTSSRIVVYRDLPGWSAPLCQYCYETLAILISDKFPPKKCVTIVMSILLRERIHRLFPPRLQVWSELYY